VYDCTWGMDVVRVLVAGELPREAHNAPLHLFSASPELVGFGGSAYRQHSANTSGVLGQLFETLRGEGFAMTCTMEDFQRDYARTHFHRLTPQEQCAALELLSPEQRRELFQAMPPQKQREFLESLSPQRRRELLESLPLEDRLAGLSEEQIQQYLERPRAGRPARPSKPRRKRK
jgi:hypothetical protein